MKGILNIFTRGVSDDSDEFNYLPDPQEITIVLQTSCRKRHILDTDESIDRLNGDKKVSIRQSLKKAGLEATRDRFYPKEGLIIWLL